MITTDGVENEGLAAQPLEKARLATLSGLGRVASRVLSRRTPFFPTETGPKMRAWPNSVLGKQLLVRTPSSVMLVTDGISDPWDRQLHPDAPPWTFGFELALDVPSETLKNVSDEAIACSWMPAVLWAATDWMTYERFDLRGRLIKFDCVTIAIPRVVGLEMLLGANGFIGGLVGIPYGCDVLSAAVALAPEPSRPADAIWLLPLKLLTPDEYDWATGVPDSSRCKALAEAFVQHESRHLSWPERPSILPRLGVLL